MTQPRFTTVALMGNPEDARVVESLRILAAHLAGQGATVLLADSISPAAVPGAATRLPEPELPRRAQLMVAVGGDGSMLYAARRVAGSGVPLLGINRGRLGFLADVRPADMLARLDEVMRGEYDTEKRMLLRAEIMDGGNVVGGGLALNDIVVNRHDPGRMLEIRTFIDGRYVNTHGGDGFIMATRDRIHGLLAELRRAYRGAVAGRHRARAHLSAYAQRAARSSCRPLLSRKSC